jgi:hypothetical protein
VKDILKKGLDLEPVEEMELGPLPKTSQFARTVLELVPAGLQWEVRG